jgi:hypothetical protein
LKQLKKLTKQETGQATLTIVVVLIGVVAVTVLLLYTMNAAVSINKKASSIFTNADVINKSGDSIPALVHTNELADSILVTASPLEGQVKTIENLATNIDKNALSIDSTAASIVQTALGINAEAVDILNTARSIDVGAKTITGQLVATVGVARDIKRDTGSIITSATSIHRNACGLVAGGVLQSLGENCAAINPTGHN